MFNKDFYPTPADVIEQMLIGVDIFNKIILEPSAGKGDIVDYLKAHGAREVVACEIEPELIKIVSTKCDLIGQDFLSLTREDVSHIDLIVMNPPFSADEKHILHAWNIAPSGCQIVSLCNKNTVSDCYTKSRVELAGIISDNGEWRNLGACFKYAERNTGATVACVNLYKPGEGENEFEGYFSISEDNEGAGENGLMSYNCIRDIVNRYVEAVRRFDSVMSAAQEINDLTEPFNKYGIEFGAYSTSSSNNAPSKISRSYYKKYLQKRAWNYIFSQMNMDKYVTASVREKINQFVERQVNVPFTMKNVYMMIDLIVSTHGNRMQDTLVEAFDTICSFSYENSTAGEKWKTNSDYMINKRFIVPCVCNGYHWRDAYEYVHVDHSNPKIDDIDKALCHLTGTPFTSIVTDINGKPIQTSRQTLHDAFGYSKYGSHPTMPRVGKAWGKWHDWGFFRVRGYKKGTMHFEFKDENVWRAFNTEVARIKGWQLPKQTNKSRKTI